MWTKNFVVDNNIKILTCMCVRIILLKFLIIVILRWQIINNNNNRMSTLYFQKLLNKD